MESHVNIAKEHENGPEKGRRLPLKHNCMIYNEDVDENFGENLHAGKFLVQSVAAHIFQILAKLPTLGVGNFAKI